MGIGRIVIVGTGHAGVQVAASLRQDGFEGELFLIGEETDLPYHKPPLSKTFLKDDVPELQLLRPEDFYTRNRVELLSGRCVSAIDPCGKRLAFADGAALAYDRLILATGARPRLPAVPGTDLDGVLALRNRADGLALRAALPATGDVVVVGGGFIGMELASTFAALGRSVTVLEAAPRILGRAVSPLISNYLAERAVASGIRILTGTGLAAIAGEAGRVIRVTTGDGQSLPAQLVVIGIGVEPNVELAAAAGLACSNGIAVDAAFRTSAPDIYAVGDVASYEHWLAGRVLRLESVQNATDQARSVAAHLLGRSAPFRAVPWFWSDQGDARLQMVGLAFDPDQDVVRGDPQSGAFSVFRYRGDRLLSIETVNRPSDHMLGRKLLAAGIALPIAMVRDAGADLRSLLEGEPKTSARAAVASS